MISLEKEIINKSPYPNISTVENSPKIVDKTKEKS